MTTYVTLGNIGLLFNLAIFFPPAYRRNPCSIYIFAASVCGLIGLNISTVPVIYALDYPNPSTTSVRFCELQFYFRHAFNQMMRTFFICACIDRYAISSIRVRIRSFSHCRTAICLVITVPIFWLLLGIWPYTLNSLENDRCGARRGLSSLLMSTYISTVVGVVPLVCMITFGALMLRNLRSTRTRVQPMASTASIGYRMHKRDRDMIRMLVVEAFWYVLTTAPLSANLLYQAISQSIVKSTERQQAESFISYFTGTFLIYLNNGLSFWIYICVSKSFRMEMKRLCMKCYKFSARSIN